METSCGWCGQVIILMTCLKGHKDLGLLCSCQSDNVTYKAKQTSKARERKEIYVFN